MNNYTIPAEALETIENMILYYDVHTVAGLNKRRPEFVVDDFNKLLRILNNITETI